MAFFDLNIPYLETSRFNQTPAQKAVRVKLVAKAMELGYTGIAYNRMFKGVMSDQDRCSIPLLTLSSLLKLAPALASSVNFHRDLLGVPRTSPFRQYTRLTVCVESVSQGQVLNSGNPILKSYDIIAVRPLNQSSFDYACERAEVDMISVDFSDKLPFRLKLPKVKAAIERGVYFEISYSSLVLDAQLRRQMISNAKLLVDWTRGKNIIFSSSAPTVSEFRGPHDVANLASLLGLSAERAKAAISINCRTLIANALKKKHFYKEAVRVELVSSTEQCNSKQPWPGDWLKWDPISSGEGDLLLDEMAKAFSATNRASKTAKAIDFTSVVDGMPSQGFRVKDLISGVGPVLHPTANGDNHTSFAEMIRKMPATCNVSEEFRRVGIEFEADNALYHNSPLKNQVACFNESQTARAFYANEAETHGCTTKEELVTSKSCIPRQGFGFLLQNEKVEPEILVRCIHDTHNTKTITKLSTPSEDNNTPSPLNEMCKSSKFVYLGSDVKEAAMDNYVEMDRNKEDNGSLSSQNMTLHEGVHVKPLSECVPEEASAMEQGDNKIFAHQSKYVESCEIMENNTESLAGNLESPEVIMEDQKHGGADSAVNLPTLVMNDVSSQQNLSERDSSVSLGEAKVIADQVSLLESRKMEFEDNLLGANHETLENIAIEKPLGEVDSEVNHLTSVKSISGKSRAKWGISHQVRLHPFKHFLNPVHFRRRGKKIEKCRGFRS